MKKRQANPLIWLIALVAIAIIATGPVIHVLTEVWWFESVTFSEVFWTRITWQLSVGFALFFVFAAFLWGNYRLAIALTPGHRFRLLEESELRAYADSIPNYLIGLLTFAVALSAASSGIESWETFLKFLNPSAFDVSDPIYQQDIGFYLFRLPLWEYLQSLLMQLIAWGFVVSVSVYSLRDAIRFRGNWRTMLVGSIKAHLSLLLVAIALLVAVGFWLDRYELLFSPGGVVFGGGFTDVHARLHSYWIMGIATLVLMGIFVLSIWRRGVALPIYGIGVYVLLYLVVGLGYPAFQQQFMVAPNELERERPYIDHNIEFTRRAYGLQDVQREDYPVESQIDRQVLEDNQTTIRNIRLWDYRPLLSTYKQLQEIRPYYRFRDVDVDRYELDGNYRQVMLSPRELSYDQLTEAAKTWVNQRLTYTHGYGLVMSPVNQVTDEGLPEFFIQDIPPQTDTDLSVDQSAIYYGEEPSSYVFTGTSTDEFDYPQGDENASTRYDGAGGVPIGSSFRRMVYSFDLASLKILISNYFTPESKIHYHRQVIDRVNQVAPFLLYDNDPYIAVIDGRLQWIIDAYTVSDRYPYAEPLIRSVNVGEVIQGNNNLRRIAQRNTNYIRNSVKVVVDAYDGTMQFFAIDDQDPILDTYKKIFPTLFAGRETVPPQVQRHFRYPLDLFRAQSQMYLTYHMSNPDVFYNREDVWRFPNEIYEDRPQLVEPYYVIMRLPQVETEEFILILPFTPVSKDNMIAWFSARSDGENYGKLLLYEFPKQELVYGPSQIEARINQNPEISQQLTLWGQEGSSVIRGDLLVIPIEQSLLYVEPVYLRAEQGELPELQRIIVAYDSQTVMADTLDDAFDLLFGEGSPSTTASSTESGSPAAGAQSEAATAPIITIPENVRDLAQSALTSYEQSQEALRQGDWNEYGRSQQELESILNQLRQEAEGDE
ncbi:MAG: UPF0182 family protein [Elainellaceae cyanobacterium]